MVLFFGGLFCMFVALPKAVRAIFRSTVYWELFELVSAGFSKLAFLPCLSLSTQQAVERKIARMGFRKKNKKKKQKKNSSLLKLFK